MYIDLVGYFYADIKEAEQAINAINLSVQKYSTRFTQKNADFLELEKLYFIQHSSITEKFLGKPETRKILITI